MNKENAKFHRINGQIRVSPVVVIGEDGRNMGSIPTQRAIDMAMELELDLVEISPTSRPPVCRIMDFGKFKFEQNMKEKRQRRKQKQSQVKEVRLSPSIQPNDLDTKLKSAIKFLEAGHRLNIKLEFRRREIAHKDIGIAVVGDFLERLKDYGSSLSRPKSEGRSVVCMVEPKDKDESGNSN